MITAVKTVNRLSQFITNWKMKLIKEIKHKEEIPLRLKKMEHNRAKRGERFKA